MEQTHSANVTLVTDTIQTQVPHTDALVTTLPNAYITVRTADCVPILIYHAHPVVGVVHAGRRGTQQEIVAKTLYTMKQSFHLDGGFSVWIGPHICVDCYQIDRATNTHFDLLEENVQQVRTMSDEQARITVAQACTYHQPEDFYSYRHHGPGTAMNFAGIALSPCFH